MFWQTSVPETLADARSQAKSKKLLENGLSCAFDAECISAYGAANANFKEDMLNFEGRTGLHPKLQQLVIMDLALLLHAQHLKWEGKEPGHLRRINEVPESVRGFSPSHTATAKISRLRQLYAVLVSIIFNFSSQTFFRTLMTKLHLHRTIRISFLGLASFHFHCILGSTQQFRIR